MPNLTRNRKLVERLLRGNPRTNGDPKRCCLCDKKIGLGAEAWLEKHCRQGTWHPIGRLGEEEKRIGRFAFHVSCALEALHEASGDRPR